MSILNRIFAGNGGGTIKKGILLSNTANKLQFTVEKEPTEYILMWVPTSAIAISTTLDYVFFSHTNIANRIYKLYRASSTSYYSLSNVSEITPSYSAGVFTLTLASNNFNTNNASNFILFYR